MICVRYLYDLERKIERLERSQLTALHPSHLQTRDQTAGSIIQPLETDDEQAEQNAATTRENSPTVDEGIRGDAELTNPLLDSPSKFMASATGRACEFLTTKNMVLSLTSA